MGEWWDALYRLVQASPQVGDVGIRPSAAMNMPRPAWHGAGYRIVVTGGSLDENNEFGNRQSGTKSGFKYEDEANNGNFDAADDGLLAGWKIFAIHDDNNDGFLDLGELADATMTTTAAVTGAYSFTLAPGNYFICEEVGATGWTQSSPIATDTGATEECDDQQATADPDLAPVGYYINVTSQSTDTNNEFGNFRSGTKSGFKYEDEANNGNFDAADDGLLAGWKIFAIHDDNNDGFLDLGELADATMTTTAAVTGAYSFTLAPGNYFICEEVGATGWTQSSPIATDTGATEECDDQQATADPTSPRSATTSTSPASRPTRTTSSATSGRAPSPASSTRTRPTTATSMPLTTACSRAGRSSPSTTTTTTASSTSASWPTPR